MTQTPKERPITARVSERPSLQNKLGQVRRRDLGGRFLAGALTSVAAGTMTLAFGSRAGGVLLAFPAILAASLTLIEEQEDSAEAREDARGAVMGAVALAVFAAIAALTLGQISGALALALATVGWVAVAFGGYRLIWQR